jgi:hypothetical protein
MEAELWGSNHTEGKSHHHLNWRQIEGEARVAVPPLGAHARQPLPDPRRRPRHDLRRRRVVEGGRSRGALGAGEPADGDE